MRVLIVDDNVEFLGSARRVLESEGVVVVGVATTGAEALRQAKEHGPDVILVDVDLGEESGFEVVEQLDIAVALKCSLVLVSAHPEGDLIDLLETSPAVGFLAKSQLTAQGIAQLLDGAR